MVLDNFRTIELIWDRANKSIIKTVKTASSDTTGRYLSVKILDGGQEVTLNGASLQLYWEHPNFNTRGTDNFNTVNNGGLFQMTFSDEMLTNVGELNAHLVLTLPDGKITSDGFPIVVFKGADDGVVVPTNGDGLVKQIEGKIDKGNVTLNDLTKEVKEALTGGAVAVVGENSVGAENIKDGAVNVKKTDFISRNKPTNLIKEDEIERNGFYSVYTDGSWEPSDIYSVSKRIEVKEGYSYHFNGIEALYGFNSSGKFVRDMINENGFFVTSYFGIKYIQARFRNENIDKAIIEGYSQVINGGQKDKSYVPETGNYTYFLENGKFSLKDIDGIDFKESDNENIPGLKDTTYYLRDGNLSINSVEGIEIINQKNLIIPSQIKRGGFYSFYTTGEWVTNTYYATSNRIELEPDHTYHWSNVQNVYALDGDGKFIKELENGFLLPRGWREKYIYARIAIENVDKAIIEKKSTQLETTPNTYRPDNANPEHIAIFGDEIKKGIKEVFKVETPKTDMPRFVSEEIIDTSKVNKVPRRLYLPDFSGTNEPWHPSVMYIKGGFAGYKYWMAQTPYPNTSKERKDRWENPIVYKSNDGFNWVTVANPLDDMNSAERYRGDWMSDTHVVYTGSQLEVWYRLTNKTTGRPTKILRKTTEDGETWSPREVIFDHEVETIVSPAIIFENGKYRMWYYAIVDKTVVYTESTDLTTWTTPQICTFTVTHRAWHLDMSIYPDEKGKYHMLIYVNNSSLELHTSDDGINFRTVFDNKKSDVLNQGATTIGKYRLYRSCSMMDENGNIRLYFVGDGDDENGNKVAAMGVFVSDSWETMTFDNNIENVRRIEHQNLILETQSLGFEMTKQNYKVDSYMK